MGGYRVLMVVVVGMLTLPLRAEAWSAGIIRLTVADTAPFDSLLWFPTTAPERPLAVGPFVLSAVRDAALPETGRFPVVVMSHGSGGGPMSHRELAAALARAGFIVVVPTHIGDSAGQAGGREGGRALLDRPRQAQLALAAALGDPRIEPHADPGRVGMIGFSAGGYTALVLAGARPDFARFAAHCRADPEDIGSCGLSPGDSRPRTEGMTLAVHPPIKALVLLDPLGVPFDAEGLAPVRVPVLLYRPKDDADLSAWVNADAVAEALPMSPARRTVPGRHFVFIDPCPPELAETAPQICRDAPGIDRAAIHRKMEADIVEFLHRQLRAE